MGAIQQVLAGQQRRGYTWVKKTSLTSIRQITYSGNGSVLVAACNTNQIQGSTDNGTTWSAYANSDTRTWEKVAVSDTGQYMHAVDQSAAYMQLTSDSGATWTNSLNPVDNWGATAMSSNGAIRIALGYPGNIFLSSNYGSTWDQRAIALGEKYWRSACMSDGGTNCYAVVSATDSIYASSDSGVTWAALTNAGTGAYMQVACNSTGSQVLACMETGGSKGLRKSTDFGASWNTLISDIGISRVSMSSSGAVILASGTNGMLYLSTDYGSSFTPQEKVYLSSSNWTGVEVSKDGTKLIASAFGSDGLFAYPS